MNPIWLEDFLTLAESGNFSRAAEQRHMTQPAFSRRIRALEEWLGVALFDRSVQPAALTDAGRWFSEVAIDLRARVARLPGAAQAVASGASATLRFAATHALSLTFLPAWLRGLEARAPLGPVQLVSDMLQHCETLMEQGRAQFLLCHAHPDVPGRLDRAGYRCVVVGTDTLLPVCRPDGPPRTVAGHVAVLEYGAESGLGRLVRALRPAASVPAAFETVFTAHLATLMRSLALEGRGLAWLPRSLIDDDLRAGRLVEATGLASALPLDVRLYRRDGVEPAAAEAFWGVVASAR